MSTTTYPTADWREFLKRRPVRRAANVLRLAKDAALLDAPVGATSIDEHARSATFVISTPTPDRSEDVVNPNGVILENYARNPVVLFDHGFSGIMVPIGKSEDPTGACTVIAADEGIEATCYFADSVEGEQIFDLVKQGVLRAASINLRPTTYTIRAEDGASGRPGMQIDEWELLEWSIVSVPDNPEAIRKILASGKLAGSPICATIRKSLLAACPQPRPRLLGQSSFGKGSSMTTSVRRDRLKEDGEDETATGMSMSGRSAAVDDDDPSDDDRHDADATYDDGATDDRSDSSSSDDDVPPDVDADESASDDLSSDEAPEATASDDDASDDDTNDDDASDADTGDTADDDASNDDENQPEPEGCHALRKCYSQLKSAHSVLERHAVRVEHPQVSKCLNKAADEVGCTCKDLADMHQSEYADKGHASLDPDETDQPITNKSAVRRLTYQTSRIDQIRSKFLSRMNSQIKRHGRNPEVRQLLIEARNYIGLELGKSCRALADVCHDARKTTVEPRREPAVYRKGGVTLTADYGTVVELLKEVSEVVNQLNQTIPRRNGAARPA